MPIADLPLAGIAACIMAFGSMLTGVAAVMTARNKGKQDAREDARLVDDREPGAGGGSGSVDGHGV